MNMTDAMSLLIVFKVYNICIVYIKSFVRHQMTHDSGKTSFLLLESHIHKLRFRIDKDATADCMQKWNTFRMKCEGGGDNENKPIVERIKMFCQLDTNKQMPYLRRLEGGMGGNDNSIHKQIRFRNYTLWSKLPRYRDSDIVFDRIESTVVEQWTYAELDDLIQAFAQTANHYLQADYVHGCIEMVNE